MFDNVYVLFSKTVKTPLQNQTLKNSRKLQNSKNFEISSILLQTLAFGFQNMPIYTNLKFFKKSKRSYKDLKKKSKCLNNNSTCYFLYKVVCLKKKEILPFLLWNCSFLLIRDIYCFKIKFAFFQDLHKIIGNVYLQILLIFSLSLYKFSFGFQNAICKYNTKI